MAEMSEVTKEVLRKRGYSEADIAKMETDFNIYDIGTGNLSASGKEQGEVGQEQEEVPTKP